MDLQNLFKDCVTEISDDEASMISGGVTVVGPRGLVQLLEDTEKDAPGLTPVKGQKIAANDNGNKTGWIEGTVPIPGH